jgi:fucose 4-O-acetylase-like acetyltransferase
MLKANTRGAGHRLDWIDAARGIGIILVVYAHAIRGVMGSGMYRSASLGVQDALIYAFHMPLFFFVSGLFAGRRPGDTASAFLKSRLLTIAWPYLLWSVVQGLVNILVATTAGSAVNRTTQWDQLLSILWQPIGQFWFLYALFICQILLLLPRPVFYVLAILAPLLGDLIQGNILSNALGDLPFFAAGVWLNAQRATHITASPGRTAVIAVGAWALFAALVLMGGVLQGVPPVQALRLVTGLAGTIGTLCLMRLVASHTAPLAYLGAASMPIYLLHVLFSAGTRIVLAVLHLHMPGPALLALVTLTGIAGPMAVYVASERLGWSDALGFGRNRRRASIHRPTGANEARSPLEPVSAKADVVATKRA